MTDLSPQMKAGLKLKKLINENYSSQEEFAFEYGCDVRTVSRYVNQGIEKIGIVQDLAMYFGVDFMNFFIE